MDLYLKRYFWVVGVVVVVLCAAFAAKAVNHVVEAKYLSDPPAARHHAAAKPATPPAARPVGKDGTALADRNMFCSTCQPETPVAPTEAGPSDPNNPPATSLPLRLIATNVGEQPGVSFATIQNTTSGQQGAYWIDQMIPTAGKVVRIRGRFVDFENSSSRRIERISLGEAEPPPAVAAVEKPAEASPTENKDEMLAAVDAGIKKLDDSNYEIDRALVDKVLANPLAFAKGARVVPAVKNGKPNGFKFYAIRPNSVYAKIGLSNGDTLNAVNGFELTTPDKGLEVFTKVRESNNRR
jgi:general secretion pathway protein C